MANTENYERLSAILSSISEAVIATDQRGLVTFMNKVSSQPVLFSPDSTEILPFEEVERQTLAHALKVMNNNVAKTAQALKMARSTLYRKLKSYQLPESD